jgi:NAD(P)-dependent dehydrogenase (short-subunit alcohol dehydrogenase family)
MKTGFARYPSLEDAVFLVSGGASGIGADVVRAAHGQGAQVAFLDVQESEGIALAHSLPGTLFIPCDLTQTQSIAAAVQQVHDRLGPVRILVNNAANDDRRMPAEIDESYWDWSMSVNLKHQFFLARQTLPHMRAAGGGSIVNFSSIAWRFGADTMTAYVTAKSAVIGLTRALARNFGPYNIRVNAIEPGAVMTEKQRKLWYPTQALVDAMVSRQKISRVLTGDEVARAVLFLASEDSRMITGQSLIVDAGMS